MSPVCGIYVLYFFLYKLLFCTSVTLWFKIIFFQWETEMKHKNWLFSSTFCHHKRDNIWQKYISRQKTKCCTNVHGFVSVQTRLQCKVSSPPPALSPPNLPGWLLSISAAEFPYPHNTSAWRLSIPVAEHAASRNHPVCWLSIPVAAITCPSNPSHFESFLSCSYFHVMMFFGLFKGLEHNFVFYCI